MASADQNLFSTEETDAELQVVRPKDSYQDRPANLDHKVEPSADLGADLDAGHKADLRKSAGHKKRVPVDRPASVDRPPSPAECSNDTRC